MTYYYSIVVHQIIGNNYILPVVVQVVEESILGAFGPFNILFGVHNLHWIWIFILY